MFFTKAMLKYDTVFLVLLVTKILTATVTATLTVPATATSNNNNNGNRNILNQGKPISKCRYWEISQNTVIEKLPSLVLLRNVKSEDLKLWPACGNATENWTLATRKMRLVTIRQLTLKYKKPLCLVSSKKLTPCFFKFLTSTENKVVQKWRLHYY